MSAIKNILVPTDFSENSRKALDFALEIALKSGANLHIMHSIEEPYDFPSKVEEVKKSLSRGVKILFDSLVEKIREDKIYEDLPIKTYIQTGRALYTILEETKNQNIDLIIMGSKGRTGLEKILWGSTTAQIIQRSDVPVLAVPKESSYNGFKQIVFASDYNDSDLKALQFVVSLAELFDSNINIFHSSAKNNLKAEIMFRGFKEIVTEKINYSKIDFEVARYESFFDAVINKTGKENISLFTMVHYEESFPPLPKQESKEMSYYSEVPLLVFPGDAIPKIS